MVLAEAIDRALNAFARLLNGNLHLPMSLALMEDNSIRDILHSGIETAKFFSQTLSDFVASFLNRILRGETLSLSVPEEAEIKAYNSKLGTAGGTYLVLTTNRNDEAFLEFWAGFGIPLFSFIGYNSTICMERPEHFNQHAEIVANPTLSPIHLNSAICIFGTV